MMRFGPPRGKPSAEAALANLAHLKRAGLLRVRRSNLCSSDPYEYNLYSAVSEDDRGAAPRAEEGPHGEGAARAVRAGDGVDVVERDGH